MRPSIAIARYEFMKTANGKTLASRRSPRISSVVLQLIWVWVDDGGDGAQPLCLGSLCFCGNHHAQTRRWQSNKCRAIDTPRRNAWLCAMVGRTSCRTSGILKLREQRNYMMERVLRYIAWTDNHEYFVMLASIGRDLTICETQ